MTGKSVIVWEAETGRELARQEVNDRDYPPRVKPKRPDTYFPSGILAVEWSPDGASLATGFNDTVQIWGWDAVTRRLALVRKTEPIGIDYGGVLWADPLRLITAEGSRLTITDLPKQTTLGTLNLPEKYEYVAVQPGGHVVAVATAGDAGKLFLYDWTAPDKAPRELGVRTTRVAFSADGRVFAAATEDGDKNVAVEIWDTTTWTSRRRIAYPKPADRARKSGHSPCRRTVRRSSPVVTTRPCTGGTPPPARKRERPRLAGSTSIEPRSGPTARC